MRYCKANPNCPVDLVIWTSRSYLSSIVHGFPTARQLQAEIEGYGADVMLEPLQQVWDTMLASSFENVVLHELGCPCLSVHEQALVIALRSLQHRNQTASIAALAAVLPPAAVRAIACNLQQLAETMTSFTEQAVTGHSNDSARRMPGGPELRVVH